MRAKFHAQGNKMWFKLIPDRHQQSTSRDTLIIAPHHLYKNNSTLSQKRTYSITLNH